MNFEDIKTLGFKLQDKESYVLRYGHCIHNMVLIPYKLLSNITKTRATLIVISEENYALFDLSTLEYITFEQMFQRIYACGKEEGICSAHESWNQTLAEVEIKLGL